jgi:hypothetical protein
MYKKQCKYCKEIIEVDKQCLFALHVCNCNKNPNKERKNRENSIRFTGVEKVERFIIKQECLKCGKSFDQRITNSKYLRNKYKKYCSLKCSNSKKWSEEHKKKLSETCKKSEKVIDANKRIAEDIKNGLIQVNIRGKGKNNKITKFVCLYCGKEDVDKLNRGDQKYHKECWLKVSGGLKKGSSRGKCGWYKGYWCDSSYELAYVIYNLDHNIKFYRNNKGFPYIHNGLERKFFPDFYKEDSYIEIKNFHSSETDEKIRQFPLKIEILYKEDLKKEILPYVISKYGKDFIKLYENKEK